MSDTAHKAADGSIHQGEYNGCAPCNGVTLYWQVRTPATAMHPSGGLVWDGYDEAEAVEVAGRDDSYRLRAPGGAEDATRMPTTCPGSHQRAQSGTGRPICPVCHRTKAAGLPSRFPTPHARLIVPEHPAEHPPADWSPLDAGEQWYEDE